MTCCFMAQCLWICALALVALLVLHLVALKLGLLGVTDVTTWGKRQIACSFSWELWWENYPCLPSLLTLFRTQCPTWRNVTHPLCNIALLREVCLRSGVTLPLLSTVTWFWPFGPLQLSLAAVLLPCWAHAHGRPRWRWWLSHEVLQGHEADEGRCLVCWK